MFGFFFYDFGEKKNCYLSEFYEKVGDDGIYLGLGYEWDVGGIVEILMMSDFVLLDVFKGNVDVV